MPYGIYVISVNITLPGMFCLNSLFSLLGATLCSFVALAIRLYGLALRIGQVILYFLIILWIFFLFIIILNLFSNTIFIDLDPFLYPR